MSKTKITVNTHVNLPVEIVWEVWTLPQHIVNWNFASDDWHSPQATNDLKTGGRFVYRMEAKDGSFGFDFSGTYQKVIPHQLIAYRMDDDRNAEIVFQSKNGGTTITETFEAETTNSVDMQRQGWQAILDNFKKYAESYEE